MPPQCNGKPPMESKKKKQLPLSLKNLTGAFVVLLVGLSLSFLAYLCEKIISLHRGRKVILSTAQFVPLNFQSDIWWHDSKIFMNHATVGAVGKSGPWCKSNRIADSKITHWFPPLIFCALVTNIDFKLIVNWNRILNKWVGIHIKSDKNWIVMVASKFTLHLRQQSSHAKQTGSSTPTVPTVDMLNAAVNAQYLKKINKELIYRRNWIQNGLSKATW